MKILKALWEAKVTIFFFVGGLFVGYLASEYFMLRYQNELMTNWILKREIKEYTINKIGENLR